MEAEVEPETQPEQEEPISEPTTASESKPDIFKPTILVFSCNWCSYTSADLAGVNRFMYPSNIRIIRFMCSGRIEPDFIMRAFEYGVDGVIVSGCRLGECHYISGNEKAKDRIEMTHKLLDIVGLGAERLRVEWMTAAEGQRFANIMQEFTGDIIKMGPNPVKQ